MGRGQKEKEGGRETHRKRERCERSKLKVLVSMASKCCGQCVMVLNCRSAGKAVDKLSAQLSVG